LKLAAIISFLSVATIATAQSTSSDDAELKSASNAYIECVGKNARELDDGISDAQTVGKAAAQSCRTELRTTTDIVTRGRDSEARERIYREQIEEEAGVGTRIVLKVRAARRH